MINRVAIRAAAVDALKQAKTLANDRVFSPRDWPVTGAKTPLIVVRTRQEKRSPLGAALMGPPQFNSTIMLSVVGEIERNTEEDAEEAAEALGQQIEGAILRNGRFLYENQVQNVSMADVDIKVESPGEGHIGVVAITFGIEVYQVFEPNVDAAGNPLGTPLTEVDAHVDATNVFDRTGTYPAPTDPACTPTPAPRTAGPDGRDEGFLKIPLTGG